MISDKDKDYRVNHDEAQLIQDLKRGDTHAFETVYHVYFQRLYLYCLQFTKSCQYAEDITQEVFTKLWLNRTQIKQTNSLRGLLFAMVRNDLISAFRRTVSSPILEDYMDYVNTIGKEDPGGIEYQEFEHQIKRAINELPSSRRHIFELSRFGHLSNRQIAEKLGINEQSVKNSISLSLKFIRSRLTDLLLILILLK